MENLTVADPNVINAVRKLSTAFVFRGIAVPVKKKNWVTKLHKTMCGLLGFSSFLMIIGIGGSVKWSEGYGIWSSKINKMEIEEYYGTRFFALFGLFSTLICFTIYTLQMKYEKIYKKKWLMNIFVFFLTMSFLCTLLALWIWSDLIRHMRNDYIRNLHPPNHLKNNHPHMIVFHNEFIRLFLNHTHLVDDKLLPIIMKRWKLGWPFWITFCANIMLFITNLLFFMKDDFRRLAKLKKNNNKNYEIRDVDEVFI